MAALASASLQSPWRAPLHLVMFVSILAAGCGGHGTINAGEDYFLVDKTGFTLHHKKGSDPCPGPSDTLTITNKGANPMQWDINGIPRWLECDRQSGVSEPDQPAVVNFRFSCKTLNRGTYSDELYITAVDIGKGAIIGVAVITAQAIVE